MEEIGAKVFFTGVILLLPAIMLYESGCYRSVVMERVGRVAIWCSAIAIVGGALVSIWAGEV